MSEYLYVPDDDSEYGPVWLASEAREHFTADELADAEPAELVVSLDGHRGHYLSAGYLSEVASILTDLPRPDDVATRDRIVNMVAEASETSETYESHNSLSGDRECDDKCHCEFIHEVCDDAESLIGEFGYVTTWNDGVTIHRVISAES